MLAAVSTGRGIVGLQDALVLLEAGKGCHLGVEVRPSTTGAAGSMKGGAGAVTNLAWRGGRTRAAAGGMTPGAAGAKNPPAPGRTPPAGGGIHPVGGE